MKRHLNSVVLTHLVVSLGLCCGCTCTEQMAPAVDPAPVVNQQPSTSPASKEKPGGAQRNILARLEQFCTQWNNPSWMLFGAENPFYSRLMNKVRSRGEDAPAQICRKVKVVKVVTGSRAAAVGIKAEFRDPRLPGQWIPKPDYCFVMDPRAEHRIVYWDDKPAETCKASRGYFRRLDEFKGAGPKLCEALYRPQERWLLQGGRGTTETCLGKYRGSTE